MKCLAGEMLLTVGDEAGEVIGHVGGESVYHASLLSEEYADILNELEIQVIEFVPQDLDVHGSTILLAQKPVHKKSRGRPRLFWFFDLKTFELSRGIDPLFRGALANILPDWSRSAGQC